MEAARSAPAQIYALSSAPSSSVAGIVGFFYNSELRTGDEHEPRRRARDPRRERLAQRGAHRHGRARAAVAGAYRRRPRGYALGLGAVYLVAGLGFIIGDGDAILRLVPVNTEDNFLHLLIGFAGVAAGPASATTRASPAAYDR